MRYSCLSMVLLVTFTVAACKTAELILLEPQLEPLAFVPEESSAPLVLRSFTDVSEEQDTGFWKPKKEYRFAPIDVLNDTLLVALRASRGFRTVTRDRVAPSARYEVSGQLVSLETSEPSSPFAEIAHPEVDAELALRVVVKDLESGEILADETVSGLGEDVLRLSPWWMPMESEYRDQELTDSLTHAYRQSISRAIAECAHRATLLVLKVAGHEPPTPGD